MTCPRCRTPRPFGASRCSVCSYAFPQTHFTAGVPQTVAARGEPAGFWVRFGAYIIDYVLIIILWLIGAVALGFLMGLSGAVDGTATDEEIGDSLTGLIYLAYFIAFFGYEVIPTALWGATPGKRLLRISVLNERGEPNIGFARAMLRAAGMFLSSLFYLGFIMAGIREDKRALHDLIAGTYPTQT